MLISTWLLLAVQLRLFAARAVRWVVGIFTCVGFGQALFWTGAVTPVVPIGWLGCALIAVNGAVALLDAGESTGRVSE